MEPSVRQSSIAQSLLAENHKNWQRRVAVAIGCEVSR